MTTHERELTQPVDLCSPDGLVLNDAAKGWSRHPLHRANLAGHVGRNKRWDYWAVVTEHFTIGAVVADLDHFVLAEVYWADFLRGATGGASILVGPEFSGLIPERCGERDIEIAADGLTLAFRESETGTRLVAWWRETDGSDGALDVVVEKPAGYESLNVVIPWDDELFNFTSKQVDRPASGTLRVGDRIYNVGEQPSFGVLDVGRGRWPARINWNWGAAAGYVQGRRVGIQFGAKWTQGSGFTENAVVVEGRLSKIGRELELTYDWDDPLSPWRIRDVEGQIDVTMYPTFDKHTKVDVSDDLGSEVHQVFGRFEGTVVTDDGQRLIFDDLIGFSEEARQRW